MMVPARAILSTAYGLMLASLCGCGDGEPLYPVHGRVTFADETPVSGGWIVCETIDREKKITARGDLNTDGTFSLSTFAPGDGAVAGKYRGSIGVPNRDDPLHTQPVPAVPARYGKFETSGIEFVVSAESVAQPLEIQLERRK